jgi:alkylhydroperoxidase family enzyme
LGASDELILALQLDLDKADVSKKERALLLLAEILTLSPHGAGEAVIKALEAGWSHQEVADAIFLVSYFNMLTRIADAFALPPDEYHPFEPDAGVPMLHCE